MKAPAPEPEQMLAFARLQFIALGILGLAFAVWELQDFAASFAAKELTTQTTLRTTTEPDDARVVQAFQQARSSVGAKASLQTEPNPVQQTRDAVLVITAATEASALQDREHMVQAMQQTFKELGGAELFDIGTAPHATPVPNETSQLVRRCFRYGALAIMLAGLLQMSLGWKRSGLPVAALLGIIATLITTALYLLGPDATMVWKFLLIAALPLAVLGLVFVVNRRVRRAQSWTQGQARILVSKVQVERHRFAGDTTKVRNLPCVEYEFDVPGHGPVRGDRISLGFGTADNVDVVLKRYAVGSSVPVYYDPASPQNCVLERDGPVSPGKLWGIGIGFAVVYVTVVLSLMEIISINQALKTIVPGLHHPLLVLVTGVLGLLALATGLWNMLHPRQAFPWVKTSGTVVSSETEMYSDTDSNRTHTYYRPVIEFRYSVEGQDYHGSTSSSSITMSTSSRSWADAEVARYPVGMTVDVYYNPQNPAQSGLNVNTSLVLNGRSSLIVAAILLAVAAYAALN